MHVRFVNSLIKNVILEGFRWTTNLFKRDSKVKHVEIGCFLDFLNLPSLSVIFTKPNKKEHNVFTV